MIAGVSSSSARVIPFLNVYTHTAGATTGSPASPSGYLFHDGTDYVYVDPEQEDVMTSSTLTGTYTDRITAGLNVANNGLATYQNGRYFFEGDNGTSFGTTASLSTSLTNIARDAKSVFWYAPGNVWMAVGNDGSDNALYTTSTNGTTWTDRTDIATVGRRATGGAASPTRAVVCVRTPLATDPALAFTLTGASLNAAWTQITLPFLNGADPNVVKWHGARGVWTISADNGEFCWSTDAVNWYRKEISGLNQPQVPQVVWWPVNKVWVVMSDGTSTNGKARKTYVSKTDQIGGDYDLVQSTNLSAPDWEDTDYPAVNDIIVTPDNKYLAYASRSGRIYYSR